MRRRADGDLVGDLHWGLYEEGDVGPFGPGDSPSVAGGLVPDVDLSLSGSEAYIDIPDLPPGAYQVLTFLDDDGDGESSDGDPVSLPSEAFEVQPDAHTTVDVELNWLR